MVIRTCPYPLTRSTPVANAIELFAFTLKTCYKGEGVNRLLQDRKACKKKVNSTVQYLTVDGLRI